MSFLVVILVSAIVINLGYIVLHRITKFLSKKIPNICESLILRFKNRLRATDDETDRHVLPSDCEYNPFNRVDAEPPIKTLKRRHRWRHHIRTCIDSLENGHGSPLVQFYWKVYQRYVPQWARYVNTEAGTEDPLPAWMEASIVAYQSVYVWRTLQAILLFYVILVLSSHLWLPHLFTSETSVSLTTTASLHAILGVNISHCDDTDERSVYCFLLDEPPSASKLRNQALRYFSNPGAYNQTRRVITDFLYDSTYQALASFNLIEIPYAMDIATISTSIWSSFNLWDEETVDDAIPIEIGDDMVPVVTKRYVNIKESILSLVSALYHEESQYVCLCAPFLNILDNVTFYRDGGEWRALFEPVIVRNSTFSDLILSSIKYAETSRFYQKDALFKRMIPHLSEERVHHDSFVVEYSEPSDASLDVIQSLGDMTEKLDLFYRTRKDATEEEEVNVKLFARQLEKPQRKRVHLTGNDAICFVYCNALNEAVLHH